jgi:hypothetical protein
MHSGEYSICGVFVFNQTVSTAGWLNSHAKGGRELRKTTVHKQPRCFSETKEPTCGSKEIQSSPAQPSQVTKQHHDTGFNYLKRMTAETQITPFPQVCKASALGILSVQHSAPDAINTTFVCD